MSFSSPIVRIAALVIALIEWVGLGTQLVATFNSSGGGNVILSLWQMFFYFTIIGNVLSAIVFTAIALGRSPSAFILGGVTITMLLIGVIYNTILAGMIELSGGALLADFLNHTLSPLLVTIFWLLLAPKGGLRWRDPLGWALLPVAYFVYGMIRGGAEGAYPYPFMNLDKLGVSGVALNAVLIAVGFFVGGLVLVGLDRVLQRRG